MPTLSCRPLAAFALLALVATARSLPAQEAGAAASRPQSTELWLPQPLPVAPGDPATAPPADSIVLFNGKDLNQWVSAQDGSPAHWTVANNTLTVDKHSGSGNIQTRLRFTNYQLHIEWRIPADVTGSGQERGNSGVFLASTGPGDAGFELQILDSYNNKTYSNGMAGSLYKQSVPLVNAARKPGDWQSYDVVWTAPVFDLHGKLQSPAFATVFWNGVLVQDHFQLKGETLFQGKPFYKAFTSAPIKLQAHGDASEPVSFRNIWVRSLPAAGEDPAAIGTGGSTAPQ